MVDKATLMMHLIPCSKNITAAGTVNLLWQHVIKLHGLPRVIYSNRGTQLTANFWKEIWRQTGTV